MSDGIRAPARASVMRVRVLTISSLFASLSLAGIASEHAFAGPEICDIVVQHPSSRVAESGTGGWSTFENALAGEAWCPAQRALPVVSSAAVNTTRHHRPGSGLGLDIAAIKTATPSMHQADVLSIAAKFAAMGYDIDHVRAGRTPVPRVYLAALPAGLEQVSATAKRKALFIKALLPLILRANEEITDQRKRLQAIGRAVGAGAPLSRADAGYLDNLAADYGVEDGDIGIRLQALLDRVDIIAPAQALAQAAEESGWGTSRFANRGNAVFGQRTFTPGNGMVPLRRDADKRHEVRSFTGLYASVRSYIRNLNTHPYYAHFRALRAAMRRAGQPLDADALVGTLERYSERGADYIATIRAIMRGNRLTQFDRAQLIAPTDRTAPTRDRDS